MIELLPELRVYFDHIQDRLLTFSKYGFQAESWFKGELVTFLDAAASRKRILAFDREVRLPTKKRVDIRVDTSKGRHWVELKHWLIGHQKGVKYGAGFYLSDGSNMGIVPDIDKLWSIQAPGDRWLLLLLTANPGRNEWEDSLANFHQKFRPRRLRAVTHPDDFPDAYFLGLLKVLEGQALPA